MFLQQSIYTIHTCTKFIHVRSGQDQLTLRLTPKENYMSICSVSSLTMWCEGSNKHSWWHWIAAVHYLYAQTFGIWCWKGLHETILDDWEQHSLAVKIHGALKWKPICKTDDYCWESFFFLIYKKKYLVSSYRLICQWTIGNHVTSISYHENTTVIVIRLLGSIL